MLGVAVAEAPTGTPVRTVSVEGVAAVPIGRTDSAAAATAVYREAMAAAIADGQSKAAFLTGKVGGGLGPAQSVVEEGGYITCRGGGEESEYAEYEGEEPDFGSGFAAAARGSAGASAPASEGPAHGVGRRPRHRRKRARARKAAAVSCTLKTQVALAYAID